MEKTRLGRQTLSVLLVVLLVAGSLYADRTRLKPGMNFFNEKQDVELGREASGDAEKQLPLLNKRVVDDYLNALGQRLAKVAPGYRYPYQFKTVNQVEINAFALPGGFLYVNRGTIEAAENEAQLAGVMAHEISHVALRHGTNQLSKAILVQAPLAIGVGMLGGGSLAGQLAQLGIQVGFTSVFLKFSRTAETQADVLGTQVLYDAGYDPQAMADFFNVLEKKGKGRSIEFFSSHPNPENRQKRIEEEVKNLGRLAKPRRDSEDFQAVRSYLRGLSPAPKAGEQPRAEERERPTIRRPAPPSARFLGYRHADYALTYPENWEVYESGTQVVFAPEGGVGEKAIAYGAIVNVLDLEDSRETLEQASDRLVRQMIQSNPGMKEADRDRAQVDGRRALAVRLSSRSPLAGNEVDLLYTTKLDGDLFYVIFIVPESDNRAYRPTFEKMVDSIRFR